MSLFSNDPRNGIPGDLGLPPQWKSAAVVGGAIVGAVLLFTLLAWLRQVWTDLLWFGSLGYDDVYKTILVSRIELFLVSAFLFAVIAAVNVWWVYRYSRGPQLEPIPPAALKVLRRLAVGGVIFVLAVAALIFGATAAGRWEMVLSYLNAVPFGTTDPQFGKDISFFVFTLPMFHFIQGWVVGALIVSLLMSGALHVALVSLRGAAITLTGAFRTHISILGALILVAFFFNYWLSIFDLSFSDRGAVFGATYADVNARMFAQRSLMLVVLAGAGVLLLNAFIWRETRLVVGVLVLWIGAAIIVGSIYPSMIQRFQVQPSELARERPYIERNIALTREAFNLNKIQEQTYSLQNQAVTAQTVASNPETFANVRLWDHRPFKDVLNQIQFIRPYYDFNDVDIDRYTVNGQYRQVAISVRELSPEKLPAQAQNWVNQRLQFTHGQGVAMAPVTEFTPDGRPIFFIKDIPPAGALEIKQPAVYFGETNQHYVIVNSKQAEFDYPTDADVGVYTKYAGKGGVQLSSYIRRVAYAWEFRDINILISPELTPESRIMYRRTVQDGIGAIAPFLRLDRDPYVVVSDGKLYWIQDAYTVTNRYPYSTPSASGFNYIRNSVKIVMDAYDGAQTYYIADTTDPLVLTLNNVFPTLFKPLSELHAGLRSHLRYPEDMFTVQAQKYLQYHMQDPTVFFNKEDQWSVPQERFFDVDQPMEPYYLNMKLPGQTAQEFVMLLPFTPVNRPNLVSWLAARSDGDHYGTLVAYTFPKDRQVDGPQQIEARIDNDGVVREQMALWKQGGQKVLRGNLLVIPVGNGLVYVEPIYLQPASLPFPELTRVIMVDGTRVIMRNSVNEAIAGLTGAAPPVTSGTTILPSTTASAIRPSGSPAPSPAQTIDDATRAIQEMQSSLQKLQQALDALRRQVGGNGK